MKILTIALISFVILSGCGRKGPPTLPAEEHQSVD